MINHHRNRNRVINFINEFQWGVPEDGFDEESDEEEDEDKYKDLDEPVEEVELGDFDDDQHFRELKVIIYSLWEVEIACEYGWLETKDFHSEWYSLDNPNKNLVSNMFKQFEVECRKWDVKQKERQDLRNLKMTGFRVEVCIKRHSDDSDDSDNSDNSDDSDDSDNSDDN